MNRETIRLKDYLDLNYPNLEDCEDLSLIQEEQESFDGEKGFVDMISIVKRKSDGKFFKVEWTDHGKSENSLIGEIGNEVFEKKKTIKYYE